MALISDDLRARLLANGAKTEDNDNSVPLIKLFAPRPRAETWLISELDPECPAIAFGLCDLGLGFPHLGYVRLTYNSVLDLETGQLFEHIQHDIHFRPRFSLSIYVKAARQAGQIIEQDHVLSQIAVQHNRDATSIIASTPRARPTFPLNTGQSAALLRFASLHGRQWKSTLLRLWENGRDAYQPDGPLLRQIRHALGPSGLLRLRIPKEHRHDTV